MGDSGCSICGAPVLARGWCRAHYKRWHKYGDPTVVRHVPNKGVECTVHGCPRSAVTKGLCRLHDQRKRRTGDTGPAELLRGAPDVCHCGQPAIAVGRCADHLPQV